MMNSNFKYQKDPTGYIVTQGGRIIVKGLSIHEAVDLVSVLNHTFVTQLT